MFQKHLLETKENEDYLHKYPIPYNCIENRLFTFGLQMPIIQLQELKMEKSNLGVILMMIIMTEQHASGFNPNFAALFSNGVTHHEITKKAVLQTTLRLFQEIPNLQGKTLPEDIFSNYEIHPAELFKAYYGGNVSPSKFVSAITEMGSANGMVDFWYVFNEERHFDSETFVKGKAVILEGRSNVILNLQKRNYRKARKTFGEILHTLQDFYSHSNWIELGYRIPNTKLIKPDEDVGNIAEPTALRQSSGKAGPVWTEMALINNPEFTDIYVFTDASAKDAHLQNAIIALIENTKSTVTFFITNPFGRRKRNSQQLRHQRSLTRDELYQKIAFTSGGQAIFTSKTSLENATSIITDTTSSALVTLLYTQSNSLNVENVFSFYVDVSLSNVTVYISGKIDTVKISNPKGQSMVDFSYYFAEEFSGPHPGFAELNGRPATGRNVSMVFSITGLTLYKSFSFTDVFFMDALGHILQTTSLQTTGTADTFLAEISSFPSQQFSVVLRGFDQKENSQILQRQLSTIQKVSNIVVKVNESSAFEPGKEHAVFFNLENNGPPMTFHIRVWNDQNYKMSSNLSSVDLGFNATKQGSLILLAPSGTESGTIVTLSIEAESSDQSDFNFALVQLTVAEKVEDFSAPKCSIITMNKNCATHCSIQQWHLTAEFQETGTGIERIYIRYGNGTLTTKEATVMGTNVIQVNYTSSCCIQDVEIIGVDKVGNVGKCESANVTSSSFTFDYISEDLMVHSH
nr:PREDICTED: von Willebrand factor A domain-containing protein 7-like [Latimeria chalumnae]|eukprot:XP_014345788.1 PREDICTED: von Willebrand factor A domain-containing protein 7-like [Latimeria chalumnae]